MATSQDFVNWVCGPELNTKYLHYVLMSEQESIRRFAHGSVHQTLYYPEAKALHVCIPSRRSQDVIAEVLGALGDKINSNRHLVTLAQRLADCHFSQWRQTIDAPVAMFGELADVYGGSTPKTAVAEYWGGHYAWAVPRDVTALSAPYLFDTERHISEIGLRSIGNRLHPAGSIFMTSRATIGAFAIPQQPCAANQGFIVVVPRSDESRWFLFHEMRSRVDEMLELANGSTFLELSRGNFKKMTTVLPTSADLGRLHWRLNPLHRWSASVIREAATLADLRDLLLPRLLSGELRVRDGEALVGEAV